MHRPPARRRAVSTRLEDLVARAKRTDRTAARRRHRAEQAALAEDEVAVDSATPGSPAKTADKTPPPARPSITAAFKGAVRPLDLRGDLRALPQVLINWGFLAAVGLTVVAAGWFVIAYNDAMAAVPVGAPASELETVVGANSIPYFVATMALQPPPAIGAFLIGFAARRASWLGGLIYGLVVLLIAYVVLQLPAGRLLSGNGPTEAVLIGHAAWSPIGAALFASAAAWYRRFLDLSNPARAAARAQSQRKPQGRGDMKPARR
jgi:hypothetical protein